MIQHPYSKCRHTSQLDRIYWSRAWASCSWATLTAPQGCSQRDLKERDFRTGMFDETALEQCAWTQEVRKGLCDFVKERTSSSRRRNGAADHERRFRTAQFTTSTQTSASAFCTHQQNFPLRHRPLQLQQTLSTKIH